MRFFILLFCCGVFSCSSPLPKEKDFERMPLDNSYFESGDIIIKRGKGYISNMIIKALKEETLISHCGIIIKEKDTCYIIHSVAREVSHADGVQTINVEAFLEDSYEGSVYIVRHLSDEKTRKEISRLAKVYLEKKIPFDYEFDHNQSSKMYCTELVHKTFLDVYHQDILKKKVVNDKHILLFNSFFDSENFKIIARY